MKRGQVVNPNIGVFFLKVIFISFVTFSGFQEKYLPKLQELP
jgi:hypothetical protein